MPVVFGPTFQIPAGAVVSLGQWGGFPSAHPVGPMDKCHSQLPLGCVLGHSRCLYKRSERQLGSRDLGAIVVVEAFQGEACQLQLEGVQFRHMGQAFRHHCSALTVTGNTWMAGELAALEVSTISCPKVGQTPPKPT